MPTLALGCPRSGGDEPRWPRGLYGKGAASVTCRLVGLQPRMQMPALYTHGHRQPEKSGPPGCPGLQSGGSRVEPLDLGQESEPGHHGGPGPRAPPRAQGRARPGWAQAPGAGSQRPLFPSRGSGGLTPPPSLPSGTLPPPRATPSPSGDGALPVPLRTPGGARARRAGTTDPRPEAGRAAHGRGPARQPAGGEFREPGAIFVGCVSLPGRKRRLRPIVPARRGALQGAQGAISNARKARKRPSGRGTHAGPRSRGRGLGRGLGAGRARRGGAGRPPAAAGWRRRGDCGDSERPRR